MDDCDDCDALSLWVWLYKLKKCDDCDGLDDDGLEKNKTYVQL